MTSHGGSVENLIASLTREVADFPTPGTQFKDLTPLFADARGWPRSPTHWPPPRPEPTWWRHRCPRLPGRGGPCHPAGYRRAGRAQGRQAAPPVLAERYHLEYGAAVLEIPASGIELAGRRVVIVDDVLATGGTLAAAHRLLEHAGAVVTMAVVVLELAELGGRDLLAPLPVRSLRSI
ncbi:adenine phosphoribosyltransferase [Mycobacterium xenopi 3993]|nr:adenine phosphoribosyltransferase [Mycobacterium xenopi 3993]